MSKKTASLSCQERAKNKLFLEQWGIPKEQCESFLIILTYKYIPFFNRLIEILAYVPTAIKRWQFQTQCIKNKANRSNSTNPGRQNLHRTSLNVSYQDLNPQVSIVRLDLKRKSSIFFWPYLLCYDPNINDMTFFGGRGWHRAHTIPFAPWIDLLYCNCC